METKTSSGPQPIQGEAWRLLVLATPDASAVGRSVVLVAGQALVLGRGETTRTSFRLQDPEISADHAEVVSEPSGGFALRDLESRNGTFVDGTQLQQGALADGSVVRLGESLLLCQQLDAAACRRLVLGTRPNTGQMIGGSHAMVRVHEEIRAGASTPLPVLILGESGVGKELVAQAIHALGTGGTLVPLNCAAVPESLAESELFGHARGAFTNAAAESEGLFGAAAGGTLFLDEVGEMSLPLQAKLLRALASGEVRGVGQKSPRRVDLKVVAATNVDLELAVKEGRFRGDLYARLRGASVWVPPLRARREDILDLARHYLDDEATISADAAEALLLHGWPWNVRELVQLASTLGAQVRAEGELRLTALPTALQRPLDARRALGRTPEISVALLDIRRDATPTREELSRVLSHFEGNVSRVAAFFGRERRQVYRWADQMGVALGDARASVRPATDDDADAAAPKGER